MALAGLWEGWRGPDGEVLRTYTIVTTDANAKLAAMHQRMPVILPREAWPAWLGEVQAEEAELRASLRPCPPEWLAVWPVSTRVNKVAENDPALLVRDPLAQPPPGLDDPVPAFGE
jgi:putative SOS response-associated peptidase YedK